MTGPASPDPPPPVDLRAFCRAWAVIGVAKDYRDFDTVIRDVLEALLTVWNQIPALVAEVERLRAAAPPRHCRYCGWRGHDVRQAGLGRELCPTCQEHLTAPQRQEPPSHE